MADDAEATVIGPRGEPLMGLDVSHVDGRARREQHPERPKRGATEVGETKSRVAVDNAVVYAIVARIDGGPWSLQLANRGNGTFEKQAHAEGIVDWLRQKSAADRTGLEYRVIPLIGAERVI